MYRPDAEDFAAWQADPITQWVFAACRKAAGECRDLWTEKSWQGGVADQSELDALRTRADAYMGLPETGYDAWVSTHEGGNG